MSGGSGLPDKDGRGARVELLELLKQRGILYAAPGQPLLDRRGDPAPWMFYSWNVTLTAEGARLAAACVLEKLRDFQATQLATYGYTAVPILDACVLTGAGRYTGLCIREQPKGHGSGRQIEGPADPRRPVVLVDDSLSSGTSLLRGIRVLEQHGFQVEGAVCLAHFPHRGGLERAAALGYRVETIFDIWDDLAMPRPVYTPGWRRVEPIAWAAARFEDGLHPAELARRAAEHYLSTGLIPRPPRRLLEEYDARGGTYVSFRDRATDFRAARDGFWHFDPHDSDAPRDVVLATVKTVAGGAVALDDLGRLKIGVTFFGPLEAITPAGLDFARYGIVVRSRAWPIKVGGALPNTQVFTSEQEQYGLARRNASLGLFEPHELFRHTVAKQVEPGASWLPYGAPDGPESAWTVDDAVGRALIERARDVLRAAASGAEPPPGRLDDDLIPTPVHGVAVTLYRGGVAGCCASSAQALDEGVTRATLGALRDERFAQHLAGAAWDELVPAVSVLYDREWLGQVSAAAAGRKLRLGLDSIAVHQGERGALFLAAVAPHYNWDKPRLTRELLAKAGIADGPATWTTYRTATWIGTAGAPHRQVFGFVAPPAAQVADWIRAEVELLGGHIAANIEPGGLPIYGQAPLDGRRWRSGTAARLLHALTALYAAGRVTGRVEWQALACHGCARCLEHLELPAGGRAARLLLPEQRCGPMADCELLHAACVCEVVDHAPEGLERLALGLSGMLQPDGSITPDPGGVRLDADHDFLPGAVLAALATYLRRSPATVAPAFDRCLEWYLRRFRCLHPWGMAGWQTQAWAAVYTLTHSRAQAEAVFEIADWALDWQLETNGAFLTDLNPNGPSFHTAFIAEGIADAWGLALELGDAARAARYRRAWAAAVGFVRRLVIRAGDAPCLPDPARGVGGVRATLDTSLVRIDYVSHALMALCKGIERL